MLDPHGALIYTMVIVTGAESRFPPTERTSSATSSAICRCFTASTASKLSGHLNDCADLLAREDGLEATLDAIKAALPQRLRETAYAIACDLVAFDGAATQEELQLLELMRERFEIDRLIAAAIERGARAPVSENLTRSGRGRWPKSWRSVREIEDRLEIYNLIAGHPPSADTGAAHCRKCLGRRMAI